MKKLIGVALIIIFVGLPAHAITGLGFGIHVGQTNNYKYNALNTDLDSIATLLGLTETLKFDEKLTLIGAHVKIGTFPILDFYGFIDYAWKKKALTPDVDFRLSDFTLGGRCPQEIRHDDN